MNYFSFVVCVSLCISLGMYDLLVKIIFVIFFLFVP